MKLVNRIHAAYAALCGRPVIANTTYSRIDITDARPNVIINNKYVSGGN